MPGKLYKIEGLQRDPHFRLYSIATIYLPGGAALSAQVICPGKAPIWAPLSLEFDGCLPIDAPVAYHFDAIGIGPHQGLSRSKKKPQQRERTPKGAEPPGSIPGNPREGEGKSPA